jgi:hypothetical protein
MNQDPSEGLSAGLAIVVVAMVVFFAAICGPIIASL